MNKTRTEMTMNVYETLFRAARQWPDRIAIIDAEGALDYQSLWREIEVVRGELARLGVGNAQGVGMQGRNGRAFIIGALAALGCGAVVMPIHHLLKPDEMSAMLARAPLCAILDDGSGRAPTGESVCDLKVPGGVSLRFTRMAVPQVPLAPWVQDAAFLRFTSGTTGAAKGVILTHDGVLERTRAANKGLGLTCEDRVLWVLPMSYHFFATILLYLEIGCIIVVGPDYLAENILAAAWRHEVTFLYVTPMHVRMLTAENSGRALPPSLRRVMSVSSRLHPQSARDFFARYGVPVAQGYGIIEVGLPLMNLDDAAEHPEAVGRPLPGFDVAILNEQMKPVANGQTGQLALSGPGMFAGYLNPPKRREEVLCDGRFLTGDLAHRDDAGRIVIDGRLKTVIDVAGHKVFPEEVAAVLDQHPAVLHSRVTTRPHPQFGEVVHAEIQLRDGSSPTVTEDILSFCRRRLSSHKVPTSIDLVAQLDLTSSGKVRHG
jgi:acyl-coenzyme A synthetase/AMP-(fatty) acid ligase